MNTVLKNNGKSSIQKIEIAETAAMVDGGDDKRTNI